MKIIIILIYLSFYKCVLTKDQFKKKFLEAKVIYGDSVVKDTPILLLNENNEIEIKTIETIGNEWISYEEFKKEDSNRKEKEQSKVNYKVWTSNGWSSIKRVIRHKCNKQIFRILTQTGSVDVTEDHSLLDNNKNIIKPNDLIIKQTKLLHYYPCNNTIINSFSCNLSEIQDKKSFLLGLFYNDGTGRINSRSGMIHYISYNPILCNWIEDIFNFEIQSDIYNLKYINEKVFEIIRKEFYDNYKYKEIPNEILNGNNQTKIDFLRGFYFNDKQGYIKTDKKEKVGFSQLFYLYKSLGINIELKSKGKKQKITFKCLFDKQIKNNFVKKIIPLGYTNDYVYDLETEDGTFQAGIGDIIVKNTDSILVQYYNMPKNSTR